MYMASPRLCYGLRDASLEPRWIKVVQNAKGGTSTTSTAPYAIAHVGDVPVEEARFRW
jgi:hypothetical protein